MKIYHGPMLGVICQIPHIPITLTVNYVMFYRHPIMSIKKSRLCLPYPLMLNNVLFTYLLKSKPRSKYDEGVTRYSIELEISPIKLDKLKGIGDILKYYVLSI